MSAPNSPYLEGNFAPVREEITVDNLTIIGELPPEINGMFVRNGPNPQFQPSGNYHWFDGDGMLHGVRLQDGKASYRNRFIRTQCFEYESDAGKPLWGGMLDKPSFRSLFRPPHGLMMKNTANIALTWHDGRLLALWEQGDPHEISVPGLETVGPYTYNGQLTHAFTAHPKIDAVTGEMMFFGYGIGKREKVHYSVVSAEGEILRTVPIHIPKAVMMHDFAVTENYTIFMDLPLEFNMLGMLRGKDFFRFNQNRPSRFGIMPRHGDGTQIRWFEGPPCFVYHTVNAWEEGNNVVLVGCRMEKTDVIAPPPGHSTKTAGHSMKIETSSKPQNLAHLHRWTFNLITGQMHEEQLDDRVAEFPRYNEDLTGRRNRYSYTGHGTMPEAGKGQLFYGLIKYDLQTGTSMEHSFGRNRYGGEAAFIPHPDASAEDDGWLVTLVFDQESEQSELVVVHAQHLDQPPVARVLIPQRVPYGFHTIWIDDAQMG
ncbi:MAG: carotenoid oxygenase family protein [Candidatus Promineifilaceae bacterium]